MLKIILLGLCLKVVTCQDVVVTVQGSIRGESGEGYTSYRGIPYASISNHDERFKKAGLAPFWEGIRDSESSHCTSSSNVEECLRLDVHVPTGSSSWPVLVWDASYGEYNTRELVRKGIIVVVVYHRLGPAGFLCSKQESIPGNAGAKDVILALRWVRDNIVAFRGNPANVVVGGQGFGAAIVEALTISPMAEGLYHGVILQSGTVLSPLTFNYDAAERVEMLNNLISNRNRRSRILLNSDTIDLASLSDKMKKPYFPFGMCVEKEFENEERVLTEGPYDLLKAGKVNSVPMIIGYNSDEGYIFASNMKASKILRKVAKNVQFLVPEELKFLNERELNQVARKIKETYFNNDVSIAALLAYHRDAYFVNHIFRSARLHAVSSHHPVYFYEFSYIGEHGVEPEVGVRKTGAAHSDDLAYLFGEESYDGQDGTVQQSLVQLWSNFVKYLNPTPKNEGSVTWEALDHNNPRVLEIGADLQMKLFPYVNTSNVWNEIYEKYYYGRYRAPV